ncbi:mitochondrial import inner membrane translocase subunit Tim10 B isoform X1 [Myotis lucifugus]|uniref:mitochondrial import inner membrane translocase subunit Tim10 B isoform X1 n=1 Tax=Myotis lucifugus TaxID=59463 RepID=UPI000CCC600C|nr:mitochondrial import inner membrane translocase subunit Tim10 B isoform X1 [Myotis lucifugus]
MEQQHQQQLRNLRDFLLVYNRMTELCFQRCVPSLHHRALDAEEAGKGKTGDAPDRPPLASASTLSSLQEACLHSCAGKLIHSNHRLMAAYVQLMPALVQRRIADYEAASAGPGAAAEQPGSSPTGS